MASAIPTHAIGFLCRPFECPILVIVCVGGCVHEPHIWGRPERACATPCLLHGHQTAWHAHVDNSRRFVESTGRHMHVSHVNTQLWAARTLLLNSSIVHNQHVPTLMPSSSIALAFLTDPDPARMHDFIQPPCWDTPAIEFT